MSMIVAGVGRLLMLTQRMATQIFVSVLCGVCVTFITNGYLNRPEAPAAPAVTQSAALSGSGARKSDSVQAVRRAVVSDSASVANSRPAPARADDGAAAAATTVAGANGVTGLVKGSDRSAADDCGVGCQVPATSADAATGLPINLLDQTATAAEPAMAPPAAADLPARKTSLLGRIFGIPRALADSAAHVVHRPEPAGTEASAQPY